MEDSQPDPTLGVLAVNIDYGQLPRVLVVGRTVWLVITAAACGGGGSGFLVAEPEAVGRLPAR